MDITLQEAHALLASGHQALLDPMTLPDMPKAAKRVRQAIERGEKIAVFGDYDVDGITSTCLLTDFLTRQGADCTWYIPARLEEGYGLNETAIRNLHDLGMNLIITVDCGITALEEAQLCKTLIDLVITDHHECKQQLPMQRRWWTLIEKILSTLSPTLPALALHLSWLPPFQAIRIECLKNIAIWSALALWPMSCLSLEKTGFW